MPVHNQNRLKLPSLLLCLLASLLFALLRKQSQVSQSKTPPGADEGERVLALAKRSLLSAAHACHDEHGDKPLTSGLRLARGTFRARYREACVGSPQGRA